MAKFNIEFDSVEKTLVVKRDGVVMDNVNMVESFKSYYEDEGENPKFHLRIVQMEENKEDDLIQQMVVMANDFEKKSYSDEIAEAINKRYGV